MTLSTHIYKTLQISFDHVEVPAGHLSRGYLETACRAHFAPVDDPGPAGPTVYYVEPGPAFTAVYVEPGLDWFTGH